MTKRQVNDELIACLRQAQELGGRDIPMLIDSLRPLVSLPGFDSLIAEEVIAWLEARLGHALPHHTKIFLNEGQYCNIAQISERLSEIVNAA
jgi:hypothetical protein